MKRGNTFSIAKTAEELVPDTVSRTGYWVATWTTLLLIGLLLLTMGKLPTIVPLFFTEPWGEARLTQRHWLWLLPSLCLAVIVVNIVLGKVAGRTSALLPRMLAVASFIVALALLLSYLGVVQSLTL